MAGSGISRWKRVRENLRLGNIKIIVGLCALDKIKKSRRLNFTIAKILHGCENLAKILGIFERHAHQDVMQYCRARHNRNEDAISLAPRDKFAASPQEIITDCDLERGAPSAQVVEHSKEWMADASKRQKNGLDLVARSHSTPLAPNANVQSRT